MNIIHNIFIDGREGTTGLRIYEYLLARKDINILHIDNERRKDINERLKKIKEADISILCLPDDSAKEIVPKIPAESRILDTSTAHRVDEGWIYGLPEISSEQKSAIEKSNRVSVPGCHATGFILIARLLISEGIVKSDYPFVCHSVTGYSGGGKKMIAEYEAEKTEAEYLSPRQYGLSQAHKHIPEMMKMSGVKYAPAFTPIVANYYCGMTVSVPVITRLLGKQVNIDEIRQAFKIRYRDCTMIEIMDEAAVCEGFLGSNNMAGKNTVQIFIYGNNDTIMISARYDNLGKGASGGAVQCMNLMLGADEAKGLI